MSKILLWHPVDYLSVAKAPPSTGCPFDKGCPGKLGPGRVEEQTKCLRQYPLTVQCEPVQSTIKVELCSMKGIMHTYKISGNAAFFALLKPQVPVQEVQSPYLELAKQVNVLCEEHSEVFQPLEGMPPDRDIEFCIDLKNEWASLPPPHRHRLSQAELAEVRKQLANILKHGWVCPSCRPYGALILFVRKCTGDLLMCVNFRMLNRQTQLDVFPIPRIADILDKLGQALVFAIIDLANAYHQVRIHELHVYRMAFFTPFGYYEFTVLPFGFTNAPSAFQHIMNTMFSDMIGEFVLVYLNNILIYSKDELEYLEYVKAVLQHFRDKQFKAKHSKCKLVVDIIKYLGYIIRKGKVSIDPYKKDAICSWPAPIYVKQCSSSQGWPITTISL